MNIVELLLIVFGVIWLIGPIISTSYFSRLFEEVPHIEQYKVIEKLPRLSIIIPSRNMGKYLDKMLRCILDRSYNGGYEIILVDDESYDNTVDVIRKYLHEPNFRYLRISGRPAGWMGKPYACMVGYTYAEGDLIAFMDADTFIHNDVLDKCVSAMMTDGIDVLSVAPSIISNGIIGRITQIILSGLTRSIYRLDRINSCRGEAWVFGTLVIWRREAYEKVGTHRSVKSSLLDDVELAKKAKMAGLNIKVYRGHGYIESEWYHDIKGIYNALSRIITGIAGKELYIAIRYIITLIVLYFTPIFISIVSCLIGSMIGLVIGLLSFSTVAFYHFYDARNVLYCNFGYCFGYPIGILILTTAIFNAWRINRKGKALCWRDRIIILER